MIRNFYKVEIIARTGDHEGKDEHLIERIAHIYEESTEGNLKGYLLDKETGQEQATYITLYRDEVKRI